MPQQQEQCVHGGVSTVHGKKICNNLNFDNWIIPPFPPTND